MMHTSPHLHRLRNLFLLSMPLFVVHGIEEYLTGFTGIDPIFALVFRPVLRMSIAQGTFVVFQVMIWLLLIVTALLLLGERWQRKLIVIPGIIYLFETHHLIEVVLRGHYYPGAWTAVAFPVFAILFWREFLRTSP